MRLLRGWTSKNSLLLQQGNSRPTLEKHGQLRLWPDVSSMEQISLSKSRALHHSLQALCYLA